MNDFITVDQVCRIVEPLRFVTVSHSHPHSMCCVGEVDDIKFTVKPPVYDGGFEPVISGRLITLKIGISTPSIVEISKT